MKLVTLPVVDKHGVDREIPINPDNVLWLEDCPIDTGLKAGGGVPIVKPGVLVVFIGGIGQRTKLTKDEVKSLLQTGTTANSDIV